MSASAPTQADVHALTFAEHVLTVTKRRRAHQLRNGEIDQAKHDADVNAAHQLVRLAQDRVIFDGPPLN